LSPQLLLIANCW